MVSHPRTQPVRPLAGPALRWLAGAVAHGSALAVIVGVSLGNLIASPPDPSLVRQAVARAERALGGRYEVAIGGAGWSLRGGALGLALDRVRVRPVSKGPGLAVDTVIATIGLGGTLRSVRLDGVEVAMPPARPGPIDLDPLQTALRTRVGPAMRALDRLGLDEIAVSGIRAPHAVGAGRHGRLIRPFAYPVSVALERVPNGFDLRADLRVRDALVELAGSISTGGDIFAETRALPLSDVWSSATIATDAPFAAALSAGPGSATALDLTVSAGSLRLGREIAPLGGARIRAVIDDGRLRVVRADADVGANAYALTGTVDALRTKTGAPAARFALAADAIALAPADIIAPPVEMAATLAGTVDFRSRRIALDRIALDGPAIAATGTARIDLRDASLTLDLRAGRIGARALATVWPSWIAGGARRWLAANVSTGELADAHLALDLAPGRLRTLAERPLDAEEIRVTARFDGATSALFGDLPPLARAVGTLDYRGTALAIGLESGEARTASGTVPIAASTFHILDTADRDLPARFDLALSGEAAALGALADAAPVNALRKAGFAPDELTGRASGRLSGTIALRAPERRDWALDLDLDRVALLRALEGRRLGDITGSLGARPNGVRLDATGTLDGVRARFDVVEPIALPLPDAPPVERRRRVEMTVDRAALAKLSPALAELVTGTLAVTADVGGASPAIDVDLTDAAVDLPWVGWSKGRGVPASARFAVAAADGGFRIEDLVVKGAGFGARGTAVIDGAGLASIELTRAALARNDDVRVRVTRKGRRAGGGYDIDVRGARLDARGILAKLDPRDKAGGEQGGAATPVNLRARIATVRGHGGVEANGVNVTYAAGARGLERVALRAALPGGQQLVVDGSGTGVFVTTDDTGTALRFLDLYSRVRGGVLTASLGKDRRGSWSGDIAASGIEILDEPKLRVMASKVSRRGRIDGSRVRLSSAEVGVVYHDGTLRFTDGIVRGPEVGAAFAGTVIDAAGRIALHGTFLPAYGLNRIFGEVPVLGALLGNGNEKGLIGITFRLSGQTRRPRIEVNPLSAIAPGIFRRVFEYR